MDVKKLWNFIVKYRIVLLLAIPIFLSVFLRLQTAYLPITDDWAENSVMSSIREQVRQQVDQQYPNLPSQNKDALVDGQMQKILQDEKAQIDAQIQYTSNAFKSRLQDDNGQTYLIEIDPYYWTRYAANILDHGHPGDEVRDGKLWDNHMYAPYGRGVPPDMFHAYFIAFLFKFVSFFNRDADLMAVSFYVPVIISALAIIPAFFITRKIAGDFGGFIAATIIAIHPSFLTRTIAGFSDTDAYNIVFPLFIAWLFLEALDAEKLRNTIALSAASGILVGIYSITWGGWWYIFDFVLASAILYVVYYSFVHRRELLRNFSGFLRQKAIKNSGTFFTVFFAASALSTALFVSFLHFTKFFTNPSGFAKLKEVGITTIWPNVFTTVAEQNPASLDSVISQVGLGAFYFFLIALIGISLTLMGGRRKGWFVAGVVVWYGAILFMKDLSFVQDLNIFLVLVSIPIVIRVLLALWESDTVIDIKYAIFLVLWFLATIFASTKGVRFTLLLVPAFAIGFGIAFGGLYRYANGSMAKFLRISNAVSKPIIIGLLLLVLIAPYQSAANTAKSELPMFDDAWASSLEKIKADSEPDAIINSWWDYGHWFKYWADRAVTFDGTSQNMPQAYWIGKALLTDEEDVAVGILRMLDCSGGLMSGGTSAFEIIGSKSKDETESISILNEIIKRSKPEAKNILKGRFTDDEAESILSYTHCQPPENYFITSEDMVGKSGVWAHFGSWDFDRAFMYNTLRNEEYASDVGNSVQFLQERFGMPKEKAEDVYYEVQAIANSNEANSWIAPWPGYAGITGCSAISNGTFDCSMAGIPLVLDTNAMDVYAETTTGRLHPYSVSFPIDNGTVMRQYANSTISLNSGRQLGIAIIKDGESYTAVAMDSDLTGSMFTRLFYQDGAGLEHFKKFSDENSLLGGRILVWKVDWEGNSTGSS